jgi:hypothetical protein
MGPVALHGVAGLGLAVLRVVALWRMGRMR